MNTNLQAVKAAVARTDAIAEYNRETVWPLLDVLDSVAELHRRQTGAYTFEGNESEGDHCEQCIAVDGGSWPCNTAKALGL